MESEYRYISASFPSFRLGTSQYWTGGPTLNAIYFGSFLAVSAQAARFFCTISNAKPEGLRPYRYKVDGIGPTLAASATGTGLTC